MNVKGELYTVENCDPVVWGRALRLRIPAGENRFTEYYIPLGQVHSYHPDTGRAVISAWIAKQKGMI